VKLATFLTDDGQPHVGAVDTRAAHIVDLARASAAADPRSASMFADMLALIDSGEEGLRRAYALEALSPDEAVVRLDSVKLLSPLPVPRSIRDCLVFEEHLVNYNVQRAKLTGQPPSQVPDDWYERPFYYKGNRFSVVGTNCDIHWPVYSSHIDFELEIACIVGRKGVNVTRDSAMEHIFGFTIFNDFSARDTQIVEKRMGMGSSKAKDFDTGNALGPWIVTTDEIGNPHDLDMCVRINGDIWGGGNTSSMHHSFSDIIAFISTCETIHPGELIGSGTVGTGSGIEHGRALKPGDTVELEIEKIGVLRNRIVRSAQIQPSDLPGVGAERPRQQL
jgi:2-keto-4-pentenoate hydratase/2-oxohepta-3-ene-1,7-dioic acid hydratase in catechol pathway